MDKRVFRQGFRTLVRLQARIERVASRQEASEARTERQVAAATPEGASDREREAARESILARQATLNAERQAAGGRTPPSGDSLQLELKQAVVDHQQMLDALKTDLGLEVLTAPEEVAPEEAAAEPGPVEAAPQEA